MKTTATIYYLTGSWGASHRTCKVERIAQASAAIIAKHPKAQPLMVKLTDGGQAYETTVLTFDEMIRKVRNWISR